MPEAKFYLTHHWWKGQFVVRGQPVSHWDLRLDEGQPSHRYWNLDKDPSYTTSGIVAVQKKCDDKRWLTFTGKIEPEGTETREWLKPGNPNKRIPAFVDRIDEGKVTIIEDTPTFISFKLYGKKLNGYWIMKKATPREIVWTFEKSKLPKAKGDLSDTTSTSIPDIARTVWWSGKPTRVRKTPRITEKRVGKIAYMDDVLTVVEFDDDEFQTFELAELEESKFCVMKSFIPMKSSRLKGVTSFVDIKKLQARIKPTLEIPYIVEENLKGVRLVLHKHGENVKIFASDRHEVTEALPTIEDEARSLSKEDIIIDGVLLKYGSNGKPVPKDMVELIFKNPTEGDAKTSFFIFDVLYYRDNSLEDLKLYERKKVLNTLEYTDHIKKLPSVLIKDDSSLVRAVKFVTLLERSVGAFIKDANSLYSSEPSDKWIEFGIKHA